MKAFKKIISMFMLILVLFAGCEKTPPPESSHPYSRQSSIIKPEVFAQSIVSTELPEFAISFSPDGKTVYFNSASADRSVLKIMESRFENGQWQPPTEMSFSDGTYRDVDPFVTPDGSRLYFSSNRPANNNDSTGDFDTWYVERTEGGWSEPQNPGIPLNSEANEIFVSVARNGSIYFSSDARGEDYSDIYRSQLVDGIYQQPELLALKKDGEMLNFGNPLISPDERFLILAANTPDGLGGADLFISYNRSGKWSEAQNLGETVNSKYTDFAPCLSPDGKYLFFTSERPGVVPEGAVEGRPPGDIFQIDLPTVP